VTELALSPAQRRMNLVAVTAAMSVTALIYGLSLPLLSLVMNERGVDGTLIGLSAATQSLAIVFVAPFLPRYMSRTGPAVIMLGAILVSLTAFLLLPVFTSLPAWFALRFAIGAAGSCLWVCGEAWINQVADDAVRGRVVALYSMAVAGGFALGPLLLSVTGIEGFEPFLISGAIILLSAVPLLSVAHTAPILGGERKGGLPHYLWLAPVAMLLCGLYALADGILLTFLPLYGLQLGLSEPRALYLITLMGVGGIIGQLPIGWLADRMNRMLLAALCTLLVTMASLVMPLVLTHYPWNLLFMLVFGAFLSGIYTIAMVLIGERFRGHGLLRAARPGAGAGAVVRAVPAAAGGRLAAAARRRRQRIRLSGRGGGARHPTQPSGCSDRWTRRARRSTGAAAS
jgi:MFS family permease